MKNTYTTNSIKKVASSCTCALQCVAFLMLLSLFPKQIGANNLLPVAHIEILEYGQGVSTFAPGTLLTFDASGSYDPDNTDIINYCWWYVDGVMVKGTSYKSSLTRNFSLPEGVPSKNYVIKLKVRDNEYSTKEVSWTITITTAGRTEYYLTDHLGSIRTTIDGTTGAVLGYDDYYPFGLAMPGRSSNTGTPNDLNKFTGVERDTEGDINLDAFGRRLYDPELGRFYGIDRFHFKYPSMNPFQYAANNPLYFIDINGDSLYVENRVNRSGFLGKIAGLFGFKRTDTYVYRGSDWVNKETGVVATNPSGFLKEVSQAVTELEETSAGSKLVSSLANGSKDVTIKKGSRNSFQGSINTATITFDPSSGKSGLNTAGNTNRPAFIGLGHEFAHSYDIFGYDGRLGITPGVWGTVGSRTIGLSEMYGSLVENMVRRQAGVPLRTHYGLDQNTNTGLLPIPTIHPPWFNF